MTQQMRLPIHALRMIGLSAVLSCAVPDLAVAQADAQPAVEELGGGRYRIGSIEVDQTSHSFTVPGTVLRMRQPNAPIEFLAGTKGGHKNYETILELDTGGVAFNLACLLIGLDAQKATVPRAHFDPLPVEGDRVRVFISWETADSARRIPAEQAIKYANASNVVHEWVYTGSRFSPDGSRYLAEYVGTLIGFVHDISSVIQHRQGLGLGDYGALTFNAGVMPPPGTDVILSVERVAE